MPDAVSVPDMVEKLELNKVAGSNRKWFVKSSVATRGDGLIEGLDWLSKNLPQK